MFTSAQTCRECCSCRIHLVWGEVERGGGMEHTHVRASLIILRYSPPRLDAHKHCTFLPTRHVDVVCKGLNYCEAKLFHFRHRGGQLEFTANTESSFLLDSKNKYKIWQLNGSNFNIPKHNLQYCYSTYIQP